MWRWGIQGVVVRGRRGGLHCLHNLHHSPHQPLLMARGRAIQGPLPSLKSQRLSQRLLCLSYSTSTASSNVPPLPRPSQPLPSSPTAFLFSSLRLHLRHPRLPSLCLWGYRLLSSRSPILPRSSSPSPPSSSPPSSSSPTPFPRLHAPPPSTWQGPLPLSPAPQPSLPPLPPSPFSSFSAFRSFTSAFFRDVFPLPLSPVSNDLPIWVCLRTVGYELVLVISSLVLTAVVLFLSYVLIHSFFPSFTAIHLAPVSIPLVIAFYIAFIRNAPSIPLPPANCTPPRYRVFRAVVMSTLLCTFSVFCLDRSGVESKEDPFLVEFLQSSSNGFFLVNVAVVAPICEEILFRGLLFARLTRVTSVNVALLVSSTLFGLLHWSEDSSKVVVTGLAGMWMATAYRWTHRLMAPILVHVLNNTFAVGMIVLTNPLLEEDWLEWTVWVKASFQHFFIEAAYHVLQTLQLPTIWRVGEQGSWDGKTEEKEGKVDFHRVVRLMFRALDRGEKGYLSTEEVAFFFSLNPVLIDELIDSFKVLEKAVPKDPIKASAFLARLSSTKVVRAERSPVALPSKDFLVNPTYRQRQAINDLYDTLTSPALFSELPSRTSQMLRVSSCESLHLHSSPVLQTLMRRHYERTMEATADITLKMRDGRMERQDFERICERMAVTLPHSFAGQMRETTTVLMGVWKHPLAALEIY